MPAPRQLRHDLDRLSSVVDELAAWTVERVESSSGVESIVEPLTVDGQALVIHIRDRLRADNSHNFSLCLAALIAHSLSARHAKDRYL